MKNLKIGAKLLSRSRLQFSHLKEHKFRYGFNDTVNPMHPCGTEAETNEHFLLRFHCFSSQRSELFDNFYNLDPSFSKLNNKEKVLLISHLYLTNEKYFFSFLIFILF